ncbi:MAG: N-acetylmuramic acid 6-phosphate etherase [Gemmatimonadetes bacterium]|nr:N-acetylmuramic acid 6-phosphate etherase [Gemmatimonadota bacterium]
MKLPGSVLYVGSERICAGSRRGRNARTRRAIGRCTRAGSDGREGARRRIARGDVGGVRGTPRGPPVTYPHGRGHHRHGALPVACRARTLRSDAVPPALDPRITEHRNPRTAGIDLASPLEIVDLMNAEDARVAAAVATQREPVARVITLVEAAFRAGGRLFYAGAGTSGRLGVLDASECPPTFGVEPTMVQGIIAGGLPALTRSQEGAEDRPEDGAAAIDAAGLNAHDVLVGIAASGTTPFVRGALARARALGARTAILACTPPPADLVAAVDVAIVPVTGPEVVTGSTRLKAGTATKLVLNMITTGAMIRVGKTFGNLMVDLKASNAKLTDRSERIVMEVCALDRDGARALLARAGGLVKRAIVMHALALDAAQADDALARAGGVVRRATGQAPPPVAPERA